MTGGFFICLVSSYLTGNRLKSLYIGYDELKIEGGICMSRGFGGFGGFGNGGVVVVIIIIILLLLFFCEEEQSCI